MKINEYQELAMRTANSDNLQYPMIINGVLGLSGEAGECADLVKKAYFQGHDLDKKYLAKELGDVAWYLAISAKAIGCNLEEIMKMNIEKLRKRYPDGFDSHLSINRDPTNL